MTHLVRRRELSWLARMFEAHIKILKYKPDLIKRRDLTNWDVEVACRDPADTKGDMKELAGYFRRDTFET